MPGTLFPFWKGVALLGPLDAEHGGTKSSETSATVCCFIWPNIPEDFKDHNRMKLNGKYPRSNSKKKRRKIIPVEAQKFPEG